RVFGLKEEELGDDEVGDLVVDRSPDENDALFEESRVDVEGTLTAACVLDHHRDEVAGWMLSHGDIAHKRHSRHALPGFSQEACATISARRSRTRRRRSLEAKERRAAELFLSCSTWPRSSSS